MASYKDYIPGTQAKFNVWQSNFMKNIIQHAAAWNLPADEIKTLADLQKIFEEIYALANRSAISSRTPVQVAFLKKSSLDYKTALRSFIQRFIRFNLLVDDSSKKALLVTVPDMIRTPRGTPDTIPVVSTLPVKGAAIAVFIRQQPGEDGTSKRGRPKEVARIEIAVFLGKEPPASPNEIIMKTQHGRSRILLSFSQEQSGTIAWIYARFIGFNNLPGPWSKVGKEIVPL